MSVAKQLDMLTVKLGDLVDIVRKLEDSAQESNGHIDALKKEVDDLQKELNAYPVNSNSKKINIRSWFLNEFRTRSSPAWDKILKLAENNNLVMPDNGLKAFAIFIDNNLRNELRLILDEFLVYKTDCVNPQ